MNRLRIAISQGHVLYKNVRATHHPRTDDIVLYLSNIMYDIDYNEDLLWSAIDKLFLIELICSIIYKEIFPRTTLCNDSENCPINEVLKKVNLNHPIKHNSEN